MEGEEKDYKEFVVFKLKDEEYGVGIDEVQEIIRLTEITPVPQTSDYVSGVINLRGNIIPVLDLHRRFKLPGGEPTSSTRIIVANIEGEPVGLKVDAATEVLKISGDDIEVAPKIAISDEMKEAIRGVGKVNGRLVILLNLKKIIQPEEREELKKVQEEK